MTATESIHATRRPARSPEPRVAIPHTARVPRRQPDAARGLSAPARRLREAHPQLPAGVDLGRRAGVALQLHRSGAVGGGAAVARPARGRGCRAATGSIAGPPLVSLGQLLDSVRSAEAAVPLTGGWVGLLRLRHHPPGRAAAQPAARSLRPALRRVRPLRQPGRVRSRPPARGRDRQRDRRRGRSRRRRAPPRRARSGAHRECRRRRHRAADRAPRARRHPAADALGRRVSGGGAQGEGLHPRRRHLPGGAGPPLAGAALARRARGLPRAAHGEPEPVHGAARDARRDAGVELARDGGAQVGRPAREPPHRRHPPARGDAGRGPPAGRGAPRRPQGARRARDAGRPPPQRPRQGGARRHRHACPTS